MFAQEMPPAARPADIQVLHEARAVHDCANLQISDYLSDGTENWAIADLVPSKASGYSTIPGTVIRDGRLEGPANAPLSVVKVGHWRLLAASTSAQVANGAYNWIETIEELRRPTPEDLYSPFVHGGIILYKKQADLSKPFASVQVVFQDWYADWKEAVKTVSLSPKLRSIEAETTGQTTDEQLAPFSEQTNPWLELQAFRNILRRTAKSDGAGDLWSFVMKKSGKSAAVMTYLMLVESPGAVPVDALLRSTSTDRFQGLVLGAFAARTFAPSAKVYASSNELLTKARQQLGTSPVVESIYRMAGLAK
jgi:hypothetical protein